MGLVKYFIAILTQCLLCKIKDTILFKNICNSASALWNSNQAPIAKSPGELALIAYAWTSQPELCLLVENYCPDRSVSVPGTRGS